MALMAFRVRFSAKLTNFSRLSVFTSFGFSAAFSSILCLLLAVSFLSKLEDFSPCKLSARKSPADSSGIAEIIESGQVDSDPMPPARLSFADLMETARSFPQEVRDDPSRLTFTLAVTVIRHFFGKQWCEDHIIQDAA